MPDVPLTPNLSQEDFLRVQEQLLELRNKNYELQEQLTKKNAELVAVQTASPKSEALQFASKFMNRSKDKNTADIERLEGDLEGMRRKLIVQEEEFRLQQNTLMEELNKVVTECRQQEIELCELRAANTSMGTKTSEQPTAEDNNKEEDQPRLKEEEVSKIRAEELLSIEAETLTKIKAEEVVQLQHQLREANEAAGILKDKISELESIVKKKKESVEDKDVLLNALEKKIVEYKDRMKEVQSSEETVARECASLRNSLEEKELKLSTILGDFEGMKAMCDEKSDSLSKCEKEKQRMEEELQVSKDQLEKWKQMHEEAKNSNSREAENVQLLEKTTEALQKEKEDLCAEAEAKDRQIAYLKKALAESEQKVEEEKRKSEELMETHKSHISKVGEEMEAEKRNIEMKFEEKMKELSAEVQTLKERHEFDLVAKEELYAERLKLEQNDTAKEHSREKGDLEKEINTLKENLAGKDHEKAVALKKQSALVKELKRSLAEERRRAEGMERAQNAQATVGGWTVVSDPELKSNQTFDGNESVSSLSVLENDNVELIGRITKMQKTHADSVDKLNLMETENMRLRREIDEKTELIEHWIRERPVGEKAEAQKGVGANLRKLWSATVVDESSLDIREMNKKLQRMLEETLSKNISLQRDLQTLLERTEM